MKATARLLQHALRLTLFTHDRCSLCADVKPVMAKVWHRRHFEYAEVDILAAQNKRWKELYEFDIPVVHVDKTAVMAASGAGATTAAAHKLKHRFNEAELERVMDQVEKS